MKELILKVAHVNWGMKGPGDWDNIEWIVFSDYSVDIKVSYVSLEDETYSYTLSKENYDALLENINLSKNNITKIDGCDGSSWEFIQYDNNKEIWRRELGYIDGIKPLETTSSILNNILKNKVKFY